jgi:hypothetical protein
MHYGVSVTNASLKIVGMPGIVGLMPAWVTNTAYTIGNYVSCNGVNYMAVTSGTSGATLPTGVGVVSDGTVSWVSMLQRPRKGFTIVNEGAIALYLSMSGPAVATRGVSLSASGGSFTLSGDSAEQCEIHAIRAAATAGNVSILEW